jgi:hypothetical protein
MRYPALAASALLVSLAASGPSEAEPADPPAGFLLPRGGAQGLGPEAEGAWKLARLLHAAAIVPLPGGEFADERGRVVPLDRFPAIWYHQGDSTDETGPVHDRKTVEALHRFAAGGHGLFLSGAALAMVETLGIETARPRRGGPGSDRVPAELVPLEEAHPIFRGLSFDGSLVRLSDAGYPAFADFHATGGPARGMLLARTPGGSENPLVEYEVGKGRVITMGWLARPLRSGGHSHRPLIGLEPNCEQGQLKAGVDPERFVDPSQVRHDRALAQAQAASDRLVWKANSDPQYDLKLSVGENGLEVYRDQDENKGAVRLVAGGNRRGTPLGQLLQEPWAAESRLHALEEVLQPPGQLLLDSPRLDPADPKPRTGHDWPPFWGVIRPV